MGFARFQQECEPAETVEQLAHQMLPYTRHEERHILNGPYLVEEWDPDVVQVMLCCGIWVLLVS